MAVFLAKYEELGFPGLEPPPDLHVTKEDINGYTRNFRDWLGLTQGKKDYEKRMADGKSSTEAKGFTFFWCALG